MSDTSPTTPSPEPFRIPDGDLDDLASTLAKTMAEVRQHGALLDRLGSDPVPVASQHTDDVPEAEAADAAQGEGPASVFILALGGEAYAAELTALSDWVNYLFLPRLRPRDQLLPSVVRAVGRTPGGRRPAARALARVAAAH